MTSPRLRSALTAALLVLSMGSPAALAQGSQPLLVEKKTFTLPSYRTVGGAEIKDVRVGWQSAGTLNAEKSNAILITHFFSGTSHAFGKYKADDKTAGYWDAIIGPGKAIDTDKYFVVSSDTLVNLNAKTPGVVTTGPASINPDTGKPWGSTFPVVTMRDFVEVQKALLESLGVTRLHAVAGASMGALQAYEWAVAYPERVGRLLPVIGAAGGDAFLTGWLDLWAQPIRLDPKWKGGDYDPADPPVEGLKAALKLVTLHANAPDWAATAFGTAPADPAKPPAAALDNRFRIEAALEAAAAARAAGSDANHFLHLVKANQLASADPAKIKAPTLILYAPTDLVFPEAWVLRTAKAIGAAGTPVETATLQGPNGHLNGVLHIGQAGAKIAEFLAK